MPNGGQLSAGSGIRLQATTPGVTDTGNENISGKLIVQNGAEILAAPPSAPTVFVGFSPICIGGNRVWSGGNGGNSGVGGAVFIGHNQTYSQNPNGNQQYEAIMIGESTQSTGAHGVTIGYQATNGNSSKWPWSYSASVVIGSGAQSHMQTISLTDSSVVIGVSAQDPVASTSGSVIIGHAAAGGGTGNCIVIGNGAVASGTNTIKIGSSTHNFVFLGPYDLSNGISLPFFKATSNVVLQNTVIETTLTNATGQGNQLITGGTLVSGSTLQLTLRGAIQWNGTPTLTLRFGDNTPLTWTTLTTAALPANAGTAYPIEITFDGHVRINGSSGTFIGNLVVKILTASGLVTYMTANIAVSGTVFDTTINHLFQLTGQWSAADALNILTISQNTMNKI
jgi:hypothetical protein